MLFSKGGVVQNDYFTRLQCTLQCCVDTITDRWIFPQGLRAFPIAFPTVLLLSYEVQTFCYFHSLPPSSSFSNL